MRIHSIQHVRFEDLGYIESWITDHSYPLTSTRLFENSAFPAMDDFDMLFIMGGPMSIYDEVKYPWLKKEKVFIKSAIDSGKVVVGICLGSQLIADALGAKVCAGTKEIGWYPVSITGTAKNEVILRNFPPHVAVMHWHGDTFDLPKGCVHLMQSDACSNQAFLYENRVLGLQFHLETTPVGLQNLVENCREELLTEKYIQSEEAILKNSYRCETTNNLLAEMLNRLTEQQVKLN